ncbi:MAG: prefoldin subunit [Candidatus Parvarchaeota archaeon]|jgi:prefoldin beta subunit|nr:prefoldin subunit [Candidatus Parvarchaeota archaeon]MCL5018038.1 prefoldin subunit [Candidatus Parvarchaeota archaeon]
MKESEYEELRQRLQIDTSQKQTMQLQYNEIKRTLEELDKTKEEEGLFELTGQLLIKKNKQEIIKSLNDKKEILEFRIKTLDKSIDTLTKQLQENQNKIEKD